MFRRHRGPKRAGTLAIVAGAALALAACGSSGSSGGGGSSGGESAQTLLTQTFTNHHPVKSGILNFSLTITGSGSSTFSSPISMQINGPFQSNGSGKLPSSHLTLSFSALGQHGAMGITTTSSGTYATISGVNYQLPQSTVAKLGNSSGTGTKFSLAQYGIHPLAWLQNPTVVGSANVGGADTSHIHAGLNLSVLLTQLATAISKAGSASSATSSLTSKLTPAELQKISSAIKNPTVDVWTGKSDHTLRKLSLSLTIAVTGKTSTSLGGLTSAGINLSFGFSDVNQPQTISAPANVQPYSAFQAKLQSLLGGSLLGGITGGSGGSLLGGSSGSTGSTGTTAGSAAAQKYTQCIEKAAGQVSKMQKCAALLQGGG